MFPLIFLPLDSPNALSIVLFLVLVFSGIGFPVPEEVTLLFGGYLSYLEFIGYWEAIIVLAFGILVGDMLGYFLGKWAGDWISQKIILRSRLGAHFLEKAKGYFERYGEKMVIFSRPMLGVRIVVPMLAGNFRMNFAKFFLYDTIAAIPWTFFLVSASYYLSSSIDLFTKVKELKHAIFIALSIAFILYSVIFFWKRRKEKNIS